MCVRLKFGPTQNDHSASKAISVEAAASHLDTLAERWLTALCDTVVVGSRLAVVANTALCRSPALTFMAATPSCMMCGLW